MIDKQIERETYYLNNMNAFSEKATNIIEHDATYINKLML